MARIEDDKCWSYRAHESDDDCSAVVIRFPSQFWNPHNPPSNLGAIPWGGDVPDNADVDKGIDGGQSTVSPLSSPEQSETEYMSQGGQEDPEVILPVPDSDEPLSTPPKPGINP